MGREARVKREQPKSAPKAKRDVKIWTREDLQRQFQPPTKSQPKPKTFTIETVSGEEL